MEERAAVVALAPAQAPRRTPGCILKTYLPSSRERYIGRMVTIAPATNSNRPAFSKPLIKSGPASRPTTATNIVRPRLLNTHNPALGMFPKLGCTERNHPKMSPATKVHPLVTQLQ